MGFIWGEREKIRENWKTANTDVGIRGIARKGGKERTTQGEG
jgi:hypothetical protein